MIKKTLCFSNPAYLSLRDAQLLIRLPEVETNEILTESFKKESERTIPIEDIGWWFSTIVVLQLHPVYLKPCWKIMQLSLHAISVACR